MNLILLHHVMLFRSQSQQVCPIWLSKGHVVMKLVAIIILLKEFDICYLELGYVI